MLFDAEGLNHRSIFVKQSPFLFSTSKTMTNIFPSLDRQAWTTTISIEKKQKNNFLLAYSNFEWVAIIVILFPLQNILCTNRIKISTKNSQMHKCHMSHFVLPVFLNSSTQESWAGCAKASLFISRKSAFPTIQLSPHSVLLFIGQSRMNCRMVTQRCHVIGWDDTPHRANCCPR